MEAQWAKMEARRGPNATPRASEKHQRHLERAKSMPRGVPEGPGPARARFCVQFGAPKALTGSRNRTKNRTESDTKKTFVSDHASGSIFIDL